MRFAVGLSWVGALGLTGCFTADLDPSQGGVFACEESSDCPEGLECANEVCEDPDALPSIQITAPEDKMRFPFDPMLGEDTMRPLTVVVLGTLTLRSRSETNDHVAGEGHVVVFVDGAEVAVLDAGPLSGGISIDTEVQNSPGPHRIRAVARRNDGIDYGNEDAVGTRLFWVDDGQPQVAIKRPWPGSEFPLDSAPVTVEVAAINFDIVAPGQGFMEGVGHTHIHYDDPFPLCPSDSSCDAGYIAVVPGPGEANSAEVLLPESGATTANLTAVLRHVGHAPYFHPFMPDDPTAGMPIFDTIQIARISD